MISSTPGGGAGVAARVGRWSLLVVVVALAAGVRLLGATDQLSTGELIPLTGDGAYHFARMVGGLRHLPLSPFDPGLSWPRGALVPWADGFDLLGVAAMRAVGGAASPDRAALAAALLPVALGLLVVWAVWSLASRLAPAFPTGAAAAAALVAAVIPQVAASSLFGRIDHHVLEALSLLLLAAWSMAPFWDADGEAARGVPLRFELLGAAIVALAVGGFAGGTLYVAMATVVRIVAVLAGRRPRLMGSGAPALALGAAATAAVTWPAIVARGLRLSFDGPSLLQPALLLVAAGGVGLALLAARLGGEGWGPRLRLLGPALLLLAAALLAVPVTRAPLVDGLVRFVLRKDRWLAGIQEFQPLLDGSPVLGRLDFFFGAPGWLAPALVPVALWEAARRSRPAAAAFAWFLLCATALTLVQVRFGRVLSPLLAVAAGLAAAAVARELATRLPRLSTPAPAIPVLLAAALVVADPRLRGAFGARHQPLSASLEAALDLRTEPLDPARPGVWCAWDLGHDLAVVGRRPTLTSGFGSFPDSDGFLESEAALGLSPPDLDAFLARRRAGTVVTGADTFGATDVRGRRWYEVREGRTVLDVEFMRAVPLSPLLVAGSALPGAGVRHLEHLMPRFATSATVGGLSFDLPLLWTYERVEGARLRGQAPPGARVVASIPLVERGRSHAWRAFADAGPDGRWEMVLPVPSSLATPTLHTAAAFELRADGGEPVRLAVPEATVRAGGAITLGAPLRPPPPPRGGAAPAPTRRSPPP